jgi:hypothetical protein
MMRRFAASAALVLVVPAFAATILGTLYRDDKPVVDLPLSLACPGVPVAAAQTDSRGSYQLSINASGKCELLAGGARATVVLFNQAPTQYDFNLQGSGDTARLSRR